MKTTKGDYKVHVFVCTNEKKGSACCAAKGADDLHKELKSWAKENPDWKKRIRINRSGCLDQCSEAVAIAIYPQNEWFLKVSSKNLDEVMERIEELMESD